MPGPKPISPQGALGLFRQHSDILSFFALTGGLLWVLRSRSMARKPLEENQERTEDAIKRENGSIFGRSVEERESHTR